MNQISQISRRSLLQTGAVALVGASLGRWSQGNEAGNAGDTGFVVGEPTASKVGEAVLGDGGNAVDAIVAAALAGSVAAPQQTGPGGYGLSAVVAMKGKPVVAIDANSVAPAAMSNDIFRPEANGRVRGQVNQVGWLSAGVPGVLAGLQKVLSLYGTQPFGQLARPAIQIAREGTVWPENLASVIKARAIFRNDSGSKKLFFRNNEPLRAGERFQNSALADMLTTLADANSVAAFYNGDIAQRIADAFAKNGGLVTAADLAQYEARIVEPVTLTWNGHTIHTAPLTAGGMTPLQILATLQSMKWDAMPDGLEKTLAKVEAARMAWNDRLTLLGDPAIASVPVGRLLSSEYAEQSAQRVLKAVKDRRPISYPVSANGQGGTIHLSAGDREGNLVALTLTHGEAFGSCVTVEDLGLTLGHGMSRFDPRPDHPNSPGPKKRPLHNMCPTIVTEDGRATMALGGAGGRRIPNSLLEVLLQKVALKKPLREAMTAPRMHTEGTMTLSLQPSTAEGERNGLKDIGYTVESGGGARISAVAWENGQLHRESQ